LSEEAAGQIFEPFFTTKQKGTGLGMAIVHRIISAHEGQISAAPKPIGGTEIRILLPRSPAKRNKFR
jgi:signal transduction histidine kinase